MSGKRISLDSRIERLEITASQERERLIDAYIAECARQGVTVTREEAGYTYDFYKSEMTRLKHLPDEQRSFQARANFAIHWYCQETGQSSQEAIIALRPHIPGL